MGGLKNVYTSDKLLGYAGTFSEELVDQIREDPMVAFVERDSIVTTMETELGAPWVSFPTSFLRKNGEEVCRSLD